MLNNWFVATFRLHLRTAAETALCDLLSVEFRLAELPHPSLLSRAPETAPAEWRGTSSSVVTTALFSIHQLHKQKPQKAR